MRYICFKYTAKTIVYFSFKNEYTIIKVEYTKKLVMTIF